MHIEDVRLEKQRRSSIMQFGFGSKLQQQQQHQPQNQTMWRNSCFLLLFSLFQGAV